MGDLSDDVLGRHDAVGLAELVRSGQAKPVELVEAAIARIEALDPHLNAVIHRRFERALDAAASPDLPDGPFRGVPFLLKDLWPSSAGDPFHMGVRGLAAAGYVAPTDSNVVGRYREAGFVICGRTNTSELGLIATTEPLAYGPTRNPWATDRGPGGSSGGSAAAVAAGMVPAANASDGAGSIRIPSASCGLFGLKPSRGRVSMGPLLDEMGLSVQHVVSHSVRDSAAILDVSAGAFAGDGVVAPPPPRPFDAEVGADPGRLRIGLMAEMPRDVGTDPACAAAARSLAATLEALGHDVTEDHPAVLGDDTSVEMFMTLWAVGTAGTLGVVGRILGRELTEDDVEPATWLAAQAAANISGPEVLAAQDTMHRFRRSMAGWWADGFDLLVCPTTLRPPPMLGELTGTDTEPLRGTMASVPYASTTAPFNVTGQPAVSIPGHFTDDGLPLGVQLVAAYGREDLLLRVGAQLEDELAWSDTRAPLHP